MFKNRHDTTRRSFIDYTFSLGREAKNNRVYNFFLIYVNELGC